MATDDDDARVPVWLDCDPGHDDTFAILLAAYHPALRILGISTVFGNAALEKTTQNATSILTAINKSHSIPVYVGASHALHRPPMHAPTDIHGESGLDGTTLLPEPTVPAITSIPAIDAAHAALKACKPNTAWVVATGAFTNVAALFQKYPDLVSHVKGVSLMGGAIGGGFTNAVLGSVDGVPRIGNWTQFAEFNVLADPEAAEFIFSREGLKEKTTLVPLDVTHLVLTTREVRELLLYGPPDRRAKIDEEEKKRKEQLAEGREEEEGELARKLEEEVKKGRTTKLRVMLVELLMFFAKTYSDVFGITAGPPLHDPLAVAAILTGVGEQHEIPFSDVDPTAQGVAGAEGTQQRERYKVEIITEGTYEEARDGARTGQVIATLLPPGEEGVRIPRSLDINLFWRVLEECVARADEANAAAERETEKGGGEAEAEAGAGKKAGQGCLRTTV
ncbi:Inosine/uridine-preferring nucleoside hydrolase domain-containing protein [Rhypophila decipiens]|uniref:Inosine/uridine-preferring nucleoside hydrolase domain-containing protein n=1 Tax=Rhypophila decipiens TaxID=261697 RepID=A0AAN6YCY1_9PEZI|nr:Inosine/uridine-preferring nucleoside hydrolase domain-containing protein [Rhypophila decipiens]